MKEKKPTRDTWLTLRLSKNEEANLLNLCRKTSCRSTSEYARAVLLKKPVVLLYRNASADDFLEEMLCLIKELKAIGNTFHQVVSLLQASGIPAI